MDKKIIKINRENLFKEKAGISYLEILILILSTFAFCYLIYGNSGVFSIASAQEDGIGTAFTPEGEDFGAIHCCPDTCESISVLPGGDECSDVCSTECIPASCEGNVGGCTPGCCYDEEYGICSNGVLEKDCEGIINAFRQFSGEDITP